MALNAAQEQKVRQLLNKAYSLHKQPIPWTKPELDAAIAAADTWQTSAKTSFNNALPAAYKTAARSQDKALLLAVVILADHIVTDPSTVDVLAAVVQRVADLVGVE